MVVVQKLLSTKACHWPKALSIKGHVSDHSGASVQKVLLLSGGSGWEKWGGESQLPHFSEKEREVFRPPLSETAQDRHTVWSNWFRQASLLLPLPLKA